MSPELLLRIAIHEAAHAVIRLYLGIGTVSKVAIDGVEGSGFIALDSDELHDQTEEHLLAVLAATLAGRAAEHELIGKVAASAGGPLSSDLGLATAMAVEMETTLGFAQKWPLLHRPAADRALIFALDPSLAELVNNRLEAAYGAARKMVVRQRVAIECLAQELMVYRILDGPDLERVLGKVREQILE